MLMRISTCFLVTLRFVQSLSDLERTLSSSIVLVLESFKLASELAQFCILQSSRRTEIRDSDHWRSSVLREASEKWLAPPGGFEPPTNCLEGSCSVH